MKFFKHKKRSSCSQLMVPTSNSQANMVFVVKINTNGPWQEVVTKVLSKLEGVHAFCLDAEQGTIQIMGNVQPEMLMNVISKSTKNAEITKAYMTQDGFNPNMLPNEPIYPSQDQNCCRQGYFGNYNSRICSPPPPSPSPSPLSPCLGGSCYCYGNGQSGSPPPTGIYYGSNYCQHYPSSPSMGVCYGNNCHQYHPSSPPIYNYPAGYPQPWQVEPCTTEESACSIM